ncbi:hypothetical protein HMPREF9577_01241 [Cutibacterium acnes HL110PA3]|nr:hypothetical protein HMPREF9603_00576 [Cutibacterium acnes HL001PA1]EFT26141.1 hypothetical protein HMPREF9577_01241 [Cutibacterium acnes HL110PA3]EFT76735.1 hypothetical protein HMPREF9599_01970 [Cutibacterium acnes HL050PA2]
MDGWHCGFVPERHHGVNYGTTKATASECKSPRNRHISHGPDVFGRRLTVFVTGLERPT